MTNSEIIYDNERIFRLEHVVGTLISWLCYGALTPQAAKSLLHMLNETQPKQRHEEWCASLVVIKAECGTLLSTGRACNCEAACKPPAEVALRIDWETGGYECSWEDFKKWARKPITQTKAER